MRLIRYFILLLPLLYMALIWFLSSNPSDAFVDTGLSFDTTIKESLHLIEFAGLHGLWVLAFMVVGKLTSRTSKLAALLAILYGFIDETHQYFVPERSATIIDLVKDTIGVLALYFILKRYYFDSPHSKLAILIKRIEDKLTS